MPFAPKKACAEKDCAALVSMSVRYCPEHMTPKRKTNWNEHTRGRSRHERGSGKAWERRREQALRRDRRLCQPCLRRGRITAAEHVHHVVSKADGGGDELENLESVCARCHRTITAVESHRRRERGYGVMPSRGNVWGPPSRSRA